MVFARRYFLLSLFGAACAPKATNQYRVRPSVLAARHTNLYFRNDANDALLQRALPNALRRSENTRLLLQKPSEIWVHKDVASFVKASKQNSHTLRAYSRYAIIHILPTRYWSESTLRDVENRLVHELIHLATFQNLGSERAARKIAPEFWFLEGIASVLSEQAHIRLPKSAMLNRLAGRNGIDDIERVDATLAYAIAHHTCAAWLADKDERFLERFIEHARDDGERGAIARALQHFSKVSPSELFERIANS